MMIGLTACASGAGGPGGSTPPTTSSPEVATTSAAPSPAGPVTEAIPKVRVNIGVAIHSLDPSARAYLSDSRVLYFVYERLFNLSPTSVSQTVPSLAEKGEMSDDGTEFTVSLKPGLKFSDGSPLTSADVVATFARLALPENPNAAQYKMIDSVEENGELEVIFHLSRPIGSFERTLALTSASIVPAAAAADNDYFTKDPAVSGPYLVEGEWSGLKGFSLVRNPNYTLAKPAVDVIELVMVDPVAAVTQLRAKTIDVAASVPPTSLPQLTGDVTGVEIPASIVTMYIFPNQRVGAMFEDPRIRQAISAAIDRKALAKLVWGPNALPQFGVFSAAAELPSGNTLPQEPDMAKAKEWLKGTRCENGCKFEVKYSSSEASTAGKIVTALQQELKPLGMDVQPLMLETATSQERGDTGNYDAGVASYAGFNADGSIIGAMDTTPPENRGCVKVGCVNPDAPAMLNEFFAAPPEEQAAAATKLGEFYAEWLPNIPIATLPIVYGVRTDLKDIVMMTPANLMWIAPLAS